MLKIYNVICRKITFSHTHSHKTQKRSIEEIKVNRRDEKEYKSVYTYTKWNTKNYPIHQGKAGTKGKINTNR